MLTNQDISDFISRHQLPSKFQHLITEHYIPLASWLVQKHRVKQPILLGINGAQGTGKSTLADFLQLALEQNAGWKIAVLSIDDFYLTKTEREKLSETIHPLLITRGVPGTHDLNLLTNYIEKLCGLATGEKLALPHFDKAQDDRADIKTWPVVTGPIDLIILEGWCVGSKPQTPEALSQPINQLERNMDPTGKWRQFVNKQLEENYAELFTKLVFLIFLQVPNFDAVFRWRLEQEEKLFGKSPDNDSNIMDNAQLEDFIQHYERLTLANLTALPKIADVILELNDNHDCIRSIYTSPRR
jgi:D-glycerate 3-kinase